MLYAIGKPLPFREARQLGSGVGVGVGVGLQRHGSLLRVRVTAYLSLWAPRSPTGAMQARPSSASLARSLSLTPHPYQEQPWRISLRYRLFQKLGALLGSLPSGDK